MNDGQNVYRFRKTLLAAYTSWEALYKMFQQNLQQSQDRNYVANGEGPIGCVCALVSACLPHIISNQNIGLEMSMVNLFVSNLMDSLKLICSHDNSSVRVQFSSSKMTLMRIDRWDYYCRTSKFTYTFRTRQRKDTKNKLTSIFLTFWREFELLFLY